MTDDRDRDERPGSSEPSSPDWPSQDRRGDDRTDAGADTGRPSPSARPFWETEAGEPDATRWTTTRPFWETENDPDPEPVPKPEGEPEPEPVPQALPGPPPPLAPEPDEEPPPKPASDPAPMADAAPPTSDDVPPPVVADDEAGVTAAAGPSDAPAAVPAPEPVPDAPAAVPAPEPVPDAPAPPTAAAAPGPVAAARRSFKPRPQTDAPAPPVEEAPDASAPVADAAPDEAPEDGEVGASLTEAGTPVTRWDRRRMGERRRPTTAEQAVPWLIGVIMALAGILLVMLALIIRSESNGGSGAVSPSPSGSGLAVVPSADASGSASPAPSLSVEPATPTPVPTPVPQVFGKLEMLYLSRATANAPIYLYRRDFSVDEPAETLARADQGVEQYAWSADGQRGVAVIVGRAVALQEGHAARALVDGVTEVAFAPDSSTVYAARVTRDGANDVAQVLAINWESGGQDVIGTATYPHPQVTPDAALKEAQFIDNGGLVRLYPTADGHVILWVLGAPATYDIDPASADVIRTTDVPVLESPNGMFRLVLGEGDPNTLTLTDVDGTARASTEVTGLVSHVRWAPNDSEVAFTVGHLGANGGVVQNLYVWDLVDGKAPTMVTSGGAAFGAEWRGGKVRWVHEPAS